MRKLILAALALALAVPTVPVSALISSTEQTQTWRGPDGRTYCKRSDGTVGLVAGGAGGVLAGRALDKNGSRTTGSVLGGAIGALLGRHIEKQSSRCR
jgi:hypothetical protein